MCFPAFLPLALQPHRERVSVQDCIQWAVKCVGTTQNRIPIVILPFPADISDFLLTDKQWLMENVVCYLSNAVKYSSEGKVTISASLHDAVTGHKYAPPPKPTPDSESSLRSGVGSPNRSLRTPLSVVAPPQLRIIVEDQGIGITAACKVRLFQPFQQTMRLAGGTGLGLYSLSKRMEALGGMFGIEDREDGQPGSRFWFSVPYQPDEADSAEESFFDDPKQLSSRRFPASKLKSAGNSISGRVKRGDLTAMSTDDYMCSSSFAESALSVLVVEDSMVITKATSRMLVKAGYEVDTAENGAVGLEKMKSNFYEFVLMDLQMPIMDGLEATRRLRAFEGETSAGDDESDCRAKQYIIGVSANGTDDVRTDAMQSGMCDFCPKPFSYQDLCDMRERRMYNSDAGEESIV